MISCRGMTFDDKRPYSPPGQLDRGAQAHGSSTNDQDRKLERCHGLTLRSYSSADRILTLDLQISGWRGLCFVAALLCGNAANRPISIDRSWQYCNNPRRGFVALHDSEPGAMEKRSAPQRPGRWS